MRRTALFRALVGSYIRHEWGRTLLTVLGICLGVAVLVAIDTATLSALDSFKSTVRTVAGNANLTVRGNGTGVPGPVLPLVQQHPGVVSAAPLIRGEVGFASADGTTETLVLLGVDILGSSEAADRVVRELEFELADGVDITDFLVDPAAMMFTRRFVEREGLELGGGATVTIGSRERRVRVAGIVEDGALGDGLRGNVIVGDLGPVDELLGRGGLLDQIDLITAEDFDARGLAAALPGSLLLEMPETRNQRVDEMTAAFRFNLRALGHISILVGAFLVYNTMSIAVVRRRKAIGTLRALGIPAAAVGRVFLAEGLLFGVVGGAAGVGLGLVVAWGLLDSVVTAVSINFVRASNTGLMPSAGSLLFAFGVGVAGSVLAAWGPARDAARTAPANTMRRGSEGAGGGGLAVRVGAGLAALALAAGALRLDVESRLPIAGYAGSTLFVIAFLFWARPALALLTGLGRGVLGRTLGPEGLLAAASLRATLPRATVAVGGLVVSVGMTIGVAVMISSFRQTVLVWLEQVLQADSFVNAVESAPGMPAEELPAALADAIAAIPGVANVDPFRTRRIELNGRPAWLGAGDFDAVRFGNETRDGRPVGEVLRQAARDGEVLVSEALANKLGLDRGGTVRIPTPEGHREFPIAGVYHDYSSEQGYVVMDRTMYLGLFDDPWIDNVAVYLEDGADEEAVASAMREAAARIGAPALTIRANRDLRALAIDSFDATFGVTYLLQVIAIGVAVLGVATTLLAQILDRRHEIATLRTIGASRARVGRLIVVESGLLGLTGVTLGVACGIGLAWILTTQIMKQSFGWTIAFHVPPLVVLQVTAVVLGATVLAGLIPLREAMRLAGDTKELVTA